MPSSLLKPGRFVSVSLPQEVFMKRMGALTLIWSCRYVIQVSVFPGRRSARFSKASRRPIHPPPDGLAAQGLALQFQKASLNLCMATSRYRVNWVVEVISLFTFRLKY